MRLWHKIIDNEKQVTDQDHGKYITNQEFFKLTMMLLQDWNK